MKLWAKIDNNNVVASVMQYDGTDSDWLVEKFGGTWIESIQNVGPAIPEIGKTWHSEFQAFLWEKPFASWIYSPDAQDWRAPVDPPNGDASGLRWSEDTQSWNSVIS
jgi:hypothetical protein